MKVKAQRLLPTYGYSTVVLLVGLIGLDLWGGEEQMSDVFHGQFKVLLKEKDFTALKT